MIKVVVIVTVVAVAAEIVEVNSVVDLGVVDAGLTLLLQLPDLHSTGVPAKTEPDKMTQMKDRQAFIVSCIQEGNI